MRRHDPLPALSLAVLVLVPALLHGLARPLPPVAPAPPPPWRPDINRAPPRHLVLLPGVGPVRARAIAEERDRAAFRDIEDLQRVRGIGPATVALLRDRVLVGEP